MGDDAFAALQKFSSEAQQKQRSLIEAVASGGPFQASRALRNERTSHLRIGDREGGFKLKEAPANELLHRGGWGPGHVEVRGGYIKDLAASLSDVLGREVVDKTGLTGQYTIRLMDS